MTYSTTKFKVATSNGLGGDTFTRNVTDGRTDGRTDGQTDGRRTDFDTKLIYPFFLKKKAGIKTCVKRPLSKRQKIGFQDQLLLNAGQKYCRMLQWEHSAILSTFFKLPFVMKIFVLSIFEWQFYTGFTV